MIHFTLFRRDTGARGSAVEQDESERNSASYSRVRKWLDGVASSTHPCAAVMRSLCARGVLDEAFLDELCVLLEQIPPGLEPDDPGWGRVRAMVAFSEVVPGRGVPIDVLTRRGGFSSVDAHVHRYRDSFTRMPEPRQAVAVAEFLTVARRSVALGCLGIDEDDVIVTLDPSGFDEALIGELELQSSRDVVIVAGDSPTSEARRWQGAKLERVDLVGVSGEDDVLDRFERAFRANEAQGRRVRVLCFDEVSGSTGLRLPSARLCRLGRRFAAHVHVDVSHSWGARSLLLSKDVNERPHSMIANAGGWMCGSRAVAFVRVERSVVTGRRTGAREHRALHAGGQEAGALLAMLTNSSLLHAGIGIRSITGRIEHLVEHVLVGLRRALDEHGLALNILTPEPRELRHGVVVFEYSRGAAWVDWLAHHPRTPIHVGLLAPKSGCARVRLSPHVYNSKTDIDELFDALVEYHTLG